MKISLAQIDIRPGDPEYMMDKIESYVLNAKKENVDIIVFPEMIFGYLIGDMWLNDEYCQYLMSFNDKIRDLSDGIGIIYGNIYLLDDIENCDVKLCDQGGRRIRFNAAYAYQDKKPVPKENNIKYIPDGIHIKSNLPNYRYFDDKRYFMGSIDYSCLVSRVNPAEISSPFIFRIKEKEAIVGVEICEDMWWEDYNVNITEGFLMYNPEIIINISASPWTYGKNKTRDKVVSKLLNWEDKKYLVKDSITGKYDSTYYSSYDMNSCSFLNNKEFKEMPACPIFAYVNCVGSQNNGKNILVFDGGTTVYGKDGKPRILAASPYKEEVITFDTNNIPETILERNKEDKIKEKFAAIQQGIKHLVDNSGIKKFVIGVSGGVDSSLVASILKTVVGEDNIIAVNMPSEFNSQKTKTAAKKLCDNLGIKDYRVIPIDKIVKAKIDSIYPNQKIGDTSFDNIQAETRGMILSAIAGNENAFFTCNGNKIEIFIGYATLNGDMRGAECPIGDLTKAEVFDMAVYVNQEYFKREVIPCEMIPNKLYQFEGDDSIEPSAELKENQKDPIKVGYHCAIVEKIMDYKKIGPEKIIEWWDEGVLPERLGVDSAIMKYYNLFDREIFIKDLEWFFSRFYNNVFKRVQSPPIIVLTKTSFGYDLRESMFIKKYNKNFI